MTNQKVKVLLSAYNGEQYIKQQIDSILHQTHQNIELYVRDDGSKDGTLKILEEYEKEGLLHLERGKNCGFIKSFFWLILHSGEADYYAFADQDDVWFPNKIEMALEKLEEKKENIPCLYFSNYDFYDSRLNFVSHRQEISLSPSFRNSLVDCMPLGFNSVFNQRACQIIREHPPKYSCGHDWWTYMVCAGLGEVIYDSRPTVKYRRHEKNVSAGGMSFLKFQIWRFKKFFLNDYFSNVHEQLKEYERLYGKKLKPEDRKFLRLFTEDKYRIRIVIKKVFYPGRLRSRWIDEVIIRMIFLIGKL